MSAEPLPTALDVRKAAQRGAGIKARLSPPDLHRFRALLAADDGAIEVDCQFSRDEENRHLVALSLTADVVVVCQRCLEPMNKRLDCQSQLAVVWTDDQAADLPRHLDPLIVAEQNCDLMAVVEEELILAMPAFSYHDTEACRESTRAYSDPIDLVEEEKPNPFDVLAQLKPGSEH